VDVFVCRWRLLDMPVIQPGSDAGHALLQLLTGYGASGAAARQHPSRPV
jgi:hypothetical protein